jgi:hypothetical protein
VEGPGRRRHPALPRLHVRQLVLRVVVVAASQPRTQKHCLQNLCSVVFVKNPVSVLSSCALWNTFTVYFCCSLYQWIVACHVKRDRDRSVLGSFGFWGVPSCKQVACPACFDVV